MPLKTRGHANTSCALAVSARRFSRRRSLTVSAARLLGCSAARLSPARLLGLGCSSLALLASSPPSSPPRLLSPSGSASRRRPAASPRRLGTSRRHVASARRRWLVASPLAHRVTDLVAHVGSSHLQSTQHTQLARGHKHKGASRHSARRAFESRLRGFEPPPGLIPDRPMA